MQQSALTRDRPNGGALRGLLPLLASPRLTLAVLAALGAGILVGYAGWTSATAALVPPLALLVINLVAAIIVSPVLSRQLPLLVLHVSLAAIVVLLAASRLCYLKGHVELGIGEEFAGALSEVEAGPWHPARLDRAAFVNDGFDVFYEPGLQRGRTVNRVHWRDADGRVRSASVGDDRPLVLAGYRFYTSPNKGFAPAFLWRARGTGAGLRGTVHLPSYPAHAMDQSIEWTPPGTRIRIRTTLHIDQPVLDTARATRFAVPGQYRLEVQAGGRRQQLRPGESIELPEGTLVFEELRAWMGYTVFSDWTTPWLLAACLSAALSLAWHYGRKFSRTAEPGGAPSN